MDIWVKQIKFTFEPTSWSSQTTLSSVPFYEENVGTKEMLQT